MGDRERRFGPAILDLVEAARIRFPDLSREAHRLCGVVVALVECIDFGSDRAVVVLRGTRVAQPGVTEHGVHGGQRRRVVGERLQRLGEIGAREQDELRVVEPRLDFQRILRELARRRVVADGDERRGEIRHHHRQLRRKVDGAQRFQRLVDVADRLVDLVGVIIGRAERVEQPETVFRVQHRYRFLTDRHQAFACRQRRLLDDQQARTADLGEQLPAAVACGDEELVRTLDSGGRFDRLRRKEQVIECKRQLGPSAHARIGLRVREDHACALDAGLRIAEVLPPQLDRGIDDGCCRDEWSCCNGHWRRTGKGTAIADGSACRHCCKVLRATVRYISALPQRQIVHA